MVGHELFGLAALIVMGTIVLASFRNTGGGTSAVLKQSGDSFAGILNAMQGGAAPAGSAQG